jgi:hypothetical protein
VRGQDAIDNEIGERKLAVKNLVKGPSHIVPRFAHQ